MQKTQNSTKFLAAQNRVTKSLLALSLLVITSGCGSAPKIDLQPVVEVRNVYPKIPAELLTCPDEPKPGVIKSDIDAAKYTEEVRVAGQPCRQNVEAIRAITETWPK